MNDKKKCKCFFSELLFDFLQSQLFDGYLNYRRYELIVICKKCFKRVKNRNPVKNQRLREVAMLYEEKLEEKNLLPRYQHSIFPFSVENYKEINEDGIIHYFRDVTSKFNKNTDLLHFIAQSQCPRFFLFFIRIYLQNQIAERMILFLIYLNDRELIDMFIQIDKGYFIPITCTCLIMSIVPEKKNQTGIAQIYKEDNLIMDPYPLLSWLFKKHTNRSLIDDFGMNHKKLRMSNLFTNTDNPKLFQLGLDFQFLHLSDLRDVFDNDAVHIFKYLLFDKNLQIDQDLINLFIDYKDSQIFKFWFSLENSQKYIKS